MLKKQSVKLKEFENVLIAYASLKKKLCFLHFVSMSAIVIVQHSAMTVKLKKCMLLSPYPMISNCSGFWKSLNSIGLSLLLELLK